MQNAYFNIYLCLYFPVLTENNYSTYRYSVLNALNISKSVEFYRRLYDHNLPAKTAVWSAQYYVSRLVSMSVSQVVNAWQIVI